jgi:hypothetical protein
MIDKSLTELTDAELGNVIGGKKKKKHHKKFCPYGSNGGKCLPKGPVG